MLLSLWRMREDNLVAQHLAQKALTVLHAGVDQRESESESESESENERS